MKTVFAAILSLILVFQSIPAFASSGSTGTTSGTTTSTAGSKTNGKKSKTKACRGAVFNPITDPDWNDVLPITIAGMPLGQNHDPPLMYEPPVCVCPGAFGIPSYGIGITYWQPVYLSEVEKIAGCSSSLGGTMLLKGYGKLNSEEAFDPYVKGSSRSSRLQLHWYKYPVFSLLEMFSDLGCRQSGGFNLAYVTEVDPTWQNDIWAGIFSPESSLFASLPAQLACIVDSVGAIAGYPVDPLFWCAGTWGGIYPMSGNAAQSTTVFQINNLVLAKFLARQARIGVEFETIGPLAECTDVPNPIWLKSQWRVDEVWPIVRHGSPLVIGAPPIFQWPPFLTNPPGEDSTVNLMFEGQQCCLRTY